MFLVMENVPTLTSYDCLLFELRIDQFLVSSDAHDTRIRVSQHASDEELPDDEFPDEEVPEEFPDGIVETSAGSTNNTVHATVGEARPVEPPPLQERAGNLADPPVSPSIPRATAHPVHAQDAGVRLAGGPIGKARDAHRASIERTESPCSTLPPPYGSF